MSPLNPILKAALEAQTFFESQHWRFCFIGGVAVQRWGEPRVTVDVDLTLLTGFGEEERFVDALLGRFAGRRVDTREFALVSRVALLRTSDGTPLDVALGAIPFEERAVARATYHDFAKDCRLLTCSAEDLVVHKSFANRDRDWADVEGVLMRNGKRLNLAQIRDELAPLVAAKNEPQILVKLEQKISELATER
jgi:hypothetical protein